MPTAIQLIPLQCFKCDTPIPAGPDEVAWVCPNCGQGLLISENEGTGPLIIHFSAAVKPGEKGRPFWVSQGTVTLGQRLVYGGTNSSKESAAFWASERTFFIPAYACSLEDMVSQGSQLLLHAPVLEPGPGVGLLPAAVHPEDARPFAEFIVMGVEASRKDNLKELHFELALDQPVLWVLP